MIQFTVYGTPRPAGSKKAFAIRKNGVPTGRVAVADASAHSKDWKQAIAHAARQAYCCELLRGAVTLEVRCYFARPKSHFGTGRNSSTLKDSAPRHHTQAPDATKLVRCLEDALNRVLWVDDSQVTEQRVVKDWGDVSRMEVTIIPQFQLDTHAPQGKP